MQLSPSIIESKQNSVVTQIAHILYITPAWTPPMRAYFLRQYSYGGREKQGLYTSQSSLRPPDFLDRGVFDMTPLVRREPTQSARCPAVAAAAAASVDIAPHEAVPTGQAWAVDRARKVCNRVDNHRP